MDALSGILQSVPGWQLASGAVLLVFTLAVIAYGYHPIARWRLRSIQGPKASWYTGNLTELLSRGAHIMYSEWGRKYGKVYKYFSGAQPVVVINDAELARLVSLRLSTRHQLRGPASLFTGREAEFNKAGLFSTNDKDFHRSAKAAWLPVFNSASLEISAKEMNVGADRLAAILEKNAKEGRELNIWRQFGHMTMDVVGSAAFGVELRTQEAERGMNSEEAERLVWAAGEIFATGSEKASIYTLPGAILPVLTPLMRVLAYYFPDKGISNAIRARNILRSTVSGLIQETRRQNEAGEKKAAAKPEAVDIAASAAEARKRARGVQPGSFLSLMINSRHQSTGEAFSDDVATSQAFTFLLAGYETTASALAFTIYCLARHPDKMERLVQEVDAFGQGEVRPGDLGGMPYLDACLKEAMRLYPPGVFTMRQPLTEDFQLKGWTIPKGTWIHMPIYAIQRDPENFEDPEAFIPERWVEGTPEEAANKHRPGSWMAFGEGTRVCVGQRFALQEAKITLARLFQRFTFKLSPGQETDEQLGLRSFFTLGPREGIFVTPVLRTEE